MNLFNRIKFAAAVFDNNPEVQKLYKSGQLKFASEIDQPAKRPDVETMEAINAFMKRNPVEKAYGGMLVKPSTDGSRPGYAPKTGHKEETEKLLQWLRNNRDTFDFANSSSADVLKASKVDLGIGTVQKYLAEQGIQTKTAIAKTQDKPKYTKKVLEELREGLPRGISLEQTRPGQYYFKVLLKGKKVNKPNITKSMVANEANKKEIIDFFNKKVKEYYPGRITDDEFKKLRLEKKDMTTEQFAKFLNSKNKTTYLGEKWNKASVSTLQNRLDIGVGTTGPLVKRTVEEARAIIDQYPGAKFFYLQNPSDSEITRYAADLISQEKTGAKGGKKGFPVGNTKENKMFRNFYDSSLKPNGRMQLITKVPTDADGRINWKKKDANGVPAWKKAKFFDKKTGATFSWGANYQPGDLEKQVDAAYGKGFFKNSVRVYDEQATINRKTFNGKALNEIFREGLLKKELELKLNRPLTNSKADQKLLQEFYALRKPSFSFTEAHHIEGVGENPFRMELSYRAANRKQNNLLNSYNAGNITKAEYIAGMENLGDTKGGIRFKTDGRFIGTTGTTESIIKAAGADIDMKPAQIKKIIASFGSGTCAVEFGKKGQRDGGRTGYKTGTVGLDDCFRSGVDNINKGNYKTADQVNDARGLLLRSKNLLRAITKYGVLPELAFIGLESAGRTIMGDSVGDAIKKSIDTFTFGLTDFTSDINKKEFDAAGGFGDMKLNVDKYKANFDKVQALKRDIQNLEAMNVGSEFGYIGNRDNEIAFKKAALKKAEQELLSSKLPEAQMKTISRMEANLADAKSAKSPLSKAALKDQMEGISTFGLGDYTGTDSGRMYPAERKVNLDTDMFPSFKRDIDNLNKAKATGLLNIDKEILSQRLDAEGVDADRKKEFLNYVDYFTNLDNMTLSDAEVIYSPEQVYGTQGTFGGEAIPQNPAYDFSEGGIAGLSGGDKSGPAPESGPQSQGLQGLMNRVKNR